MEYQVTNSEIVKKKEINYQFKVLYVIGIFFVVAGHANADDFIYLNEIMHVAGFHMALFIFSSGYFYSSKNDEKPITYILKKMKRLLIPFFFWNLFYGIFVFFSSRFGFTIGLPVTWQRLTYLPFINGPLFVYNLPAWFVVPLFVTEVYNVLVRRCLIKVGEFVKSVGLLLFNLLLGIIGLYLAIKGLNTDGWMFLTRFMYFAPFYSFGYFYKMYLEKYDVKIPSFWYLGGILLIELFVILVYGHSLFYSIVGMFNFENPVSPFIIGTMGIAFWLRISKIVAPVIGKSKYINLIADNTFSIMTNHEFGFFILNCVFFIISSNFFQLPGFDTENFFSHIEYLYLPVKNGFQILYIGVGFGFSLLMQKIVSCIFEKFDILVLKGC